MNYYPWIVSHYSSTNSSTLLFINNITKSVPLYTFHYMGGILNAPYL